jgi:hypothetical protein
LQFAFHWLSETGAVVQEKAIAVAADGKRCIQHFGIGQGLLHAMPN